MNSLPSPYVHQPELQVLDAAASGDQDARHELFERYREPAYRAAYRITGRTEDALDVVQDSFITAFTKLDSFQRESGFKTWLLRIVTNRALDLLRARRVRLAVSLDRDDDQRPLVPAHPAESSAGARLERAELAAQLRRALEALPPDQRAAFALYAEGDMTYGQIAAVLGIPIGTVMSRLYHARLRLRAALPELDT